MVVQFDHNCMLNNPDHKVCFPIVSACTDTITVPTAHMEEYKSFKTNFLTAMQYGVTFDRSQLVTCPCQIKIPVLDKGT